MSRTLDLETVVKPTCFSHFVLKVQNLERSKDWYFKVFGMEVVHEGPGLAFLTYDEEHHRLALIESPMSDVAGDDALGVDHVAYTLPDLGALLSHYRRLEAHGILPVLPINHGFTTSMYYQDPDGNRVEFQVENFATADEMKGFMHSKAFEKNPLGTVFDPDRLIDLYEQGQPLQELVKQGSA